MNTTRYIDLNADLGEGFSVDADMLRVVTSANVASGAYTQNVGAIERALSHAHKLNAVVGAHLGYPDREGFGRRAQFLPADQLEASLGEQVEWMLKACAHVAVGFRPRYLKPHGALYHDAAQHESYARAILAVAAQHDLPVLHAPTGQLHKLAVDHPIIPEGFADRRYQVGGRLVSRTMAGAVLSNPDEVVAQAIALAAGKPIESVEGQQLKVQVQSICLHGDTPGAVRLAHAVRDGLVQAGLSLKSAVDA